MLTKKIAQEILNRLVETCEKAPQGVVSLILFGSVARNDFDLDSDIDIMVVSTDPEESKQYFRAVVDELFLRYSVPISVIYVRPERLEKKDTFIQNVLKEGKVLWGRKKTR